MTAEKNSGSERPLKTLLIELCSSNPKVRASAAGVLLKLAEDNQTVLEALAQVQPLPPTVARAFSEKLGSSSYHVASTALRGLVNLPPKLRGKWIPLMLDHLKRFRNNSEWSWIIECLAPHFRQHRKCIEPALRAGLKSDYAFGPHSVMDALREIGPAAAALVPDVLAYIGRQRAFTNEEPHLIHIDPKGKKAIPGLIRLLRHRKETVRVQAADELAAYGAYAYATVPILTELANRNQGMDQSALRQALDAIQQSPARDPRKKSATDRVLELVAKAATKK